MDTLDAMRAAVWRMFPQANEVSVDAETTSRRDGWEERVYSITVRLGVARSFVAVGNTLEEVMGKLMSKGVRMGRSLAGVGNN